ncbi:MAG TPA: helix-hairpin-helix domain-containing protein [Pyrinomonadaceae bacterium]|nr:helix-hairpin-helix domain-containing protein [Pyrinomonadaceae bacterium]
MRLSDRYDGSRLPFQGDRSTLLQSIPINARIERATVTVTPNDATDGVEPFAETTTFDGVAGSWGATKTVVAGQWVEVDFHARRTLVGVSGSNLIDTTLQVDFGGVFVDLSSTGSVRTPSDPAPFPIKSNTPRLPSLTVMKIKLTNPVGRATTPDLTHVTFRSLASNVTLRLGESAPFWARVGELVAPETTPDFAPLLQAFLSKAKSENGFYQVPLVLHTDTLARLSLSLQIDYLIEQNVLPPGLREVTLPFDLSTRPSTSQEVLHIAVPAGARVARRGASVRVNGTFESTRLVRETEMNVAPDGSVEVSPAFSHAQPVRLTAEALASEVDLLLTVSRAAKLQLDIREDLDGKPGVQSLLPAPVAQDLPAPVGLAPARRSEGETRWLSVRLPAEFQFKAATTYWLVLQSLEGTFGWKVARAPVEAATLQRTDTGGLSWRDELAPTSNEKLRAFFRLRRRPENFEMPIELEIGKGTEAVRLNLDRFQPLGRVDFELDPDNLSQALNEYLDKAAQGASCSGVEHLFNCDFEQWLRVGDTPIPVGSRPLNRFPLSLAFAPDGSWAYLGLTSPDRESNSLQLIDVACDALVEPAIPLSFPPEILVISPQGTRAYVTDGRRLQIIDTIAHKSLGVLEESPNNNADIRALVISQDGERLYAAIQNQATTFGVTFNIVLVETAQLEQAVMQGASQMQDSTLVKRSFQLTAESVALALSPDGNRLYVATTEQQSKRGELRLLPAESLRAPGDIVLVGKEPASIALSADGKRVAVANAGDNTLSVLDTTTRSIISTLPLNQPVTEFRPLAVALSPEGTRAYVTSRRPATGTPRQVLLVVDVDKGALIKTFELQRFPTALALNPQGDQLYVGEGAFSDTTGTQEGALFSVRVGTRLPAEWGLTSGVVSPLCYPKPLHVVAQLGDFAQVESGRPTTLSQVVPVTGLCSYDLTFEALASQESAVVEVFWIDDACGVQQTDSIPVEAFRPPHDTVSHQLLSAIQQQAFNEKPPLALHRRRLSAPAGATQAEVRFNVPPGIVALVGSISLMGTIETLQNTDMALKTGGQPDGWQLLPAVAPGVSLNTSGDEIQLRNNGAAAAELMQSIAVEGERLFVLELKGRTEKSPTARNNPSLELRWFKADDSQASAPVVLNLSPEGFASASANGTTPADATRAEIHLIVPAGTTQRISNISLRLLPTVDVPITFVAQSPGELSVFDWRIAFEEAEAARPPIPKQGLCVATPPGRLPGRTHDDYHYCPHCGAEQLVAESTPALTPAGHPASVEVCSVCGTKSASVGGTNAKTAQPLAAHLPPARSSSVGHSEHVHTAASVEGTEGATAQPLLAIVGIGPVRSMQLTAIGINSLQTLAAATPEDIMQVKGITPKLAADFIRQAKTLLASDA